MSRVEEKGGHFLEMGVLLQMYYQQANTYSKSTIETLEKGANKDKICKICSKLTTKTPERYQWRHIMLNLNIFHTFF